MADANEAESVLYAVPIGAHEKRGIDVGGWCWGSCGKGLVGGINFPNDSGIPCATPAAECPHHDKDSPRPWGEVDDGFKTHTVYLRRLKP